MAKSDLFDFDADTPGNNTDVAGTSVAENCPAGNLNDAIRAVMSIVKRAAGDQGSDIASSSTCAIAAAGTSLYAKITGTTAITGFGTVAAGTLRIVEFAAALTLTHNASSLILPGSTNITTAAGDTALMLSLGSGNWKCAFYQTQSGSVVGGFSSLTATSTDAGATAGPDIKAFRNSASPADNDLIGRLLFNGRDESSNEDTYASVEAQILDATGATEDALLMIKTVVAGSLAARVSVGQGVQVGSPTGGDKGSATVNATNYYRAGSLIDGFAQQLLHIRDEKTSGTDGGSSVADTWTKHTLNDTKTNEISGASESSSVITLPAGTYWIEAWSTFYAADECKIRWRNTTDGTTAVVGANGYNNGGADAASSHTPLAGRFTIAGAKDFELQYWCQLSQATNGLGAAATSGEVEIYAEAMIWKLA